MCSISFTYYEVCSSLSLGSVYRDVDAGQPYPIRCSLGDNCNMIFPKLNFNMQIFCQKLNYTPSILVYKDLILTFLESCDGILKFNIQKRIIYTNLIIRTKKFISVLIFEFRFRCSKFRKFSYSIM